MIAERFLVFVFFCVIGYFIAYVWMIPKEPYSND